MADFTNFVAQLKRCGRNISECEFQHIPVSFGKAALVVVNSHTAFRGAQTVAHSHAHAVGVTCQSDAVALCQLFKFFQYEIFYMHNPQACAFIPILTHFATRTNVHLVVTYLGQATEDTFVFEDGDVPQGDVMDVLATKAPGLKVLFLADVTLPGAFWVKEVPEGVVACASLPGEKTSPNTIRRYQSQGIFSFNFVRALHAKKEGSPNEISAALGAPLGEFGHSLSVVANPPGLADEPMLVVDFKD